MGGAGVADSGCLARFACLGRCKHGGLPAEKRHRKVEPRPRGQGRRPQTPPEQHRVEVGLDTYAFYIFLCCVK
eukprot:2909048-Pyramimonas_sp.AAC.1